MDKMTKQQALDQGYTKCGYAGRDWQFAMDIKDLTADDFDNPSGNKLVLFGKDEMFTSVSADTIKDMVSDMAEENRGSETGDDTNQCYEAVQQMPLAPFEVLAEAVNKVLAGHGYYNLTEIELLP